MLLKHTNVHSMSSPGGFVKVDQAIGSKHHDLEAGAKVKKKPI